MGINVRKGKAEDDGFILEGNIHVTQRELEALAAIAEGNDNENGANKLGIRYTTFRNHTYNIMKKLQAKNRTEALVKAVENGMIVINPKRELIEKSRGIWVVCMYCGRGFTWDEKITIEEKPIIVNHVKVHPPEWIQCPYEDCNGNAIDAFTWTEVREYHPEYPTIPEKGVVYSTSELVDMLIQEQEERMSGWRERNQ